MTYVLYAIFGVAFFTGAYFAVLSILTHRDDHDD